jgi:hypothetical protein
MRFSFRISRNECSSFYQDTKNEELDLVEGSVPSEAVKEAAHEVRSGDEGAPAAPGVMTPPVGKKLWMMVIHLNLLAP